MLLLSLIAFVGEPYYWIRKHDLPLDSMVMQQRYRLGYAPVPFVPILAGSFDMGEQSVEFRKDLPEETLPKFGVPGKHVDIAPGFSSGKYEVTYEQYDYYVWEQHRAGHGDVAYATTAKGGRGTRPVVNVTWDQSMAYVGWLGEAEWEYAARAKTNTAYPWGNEVRRKKDDKEEIMANCDGRGSPWEKTNQLPWEVFPPMRLVFTTRQETCGNGPVRCGARDLTGMSSDVPSRGILRPVWCTAGPDKALTQPSLPAQTRAREAAELVLAVAGNRAYIQVLMSQVRIYVTGPTFTPP